MGELERSRYEIYQKKSDILLKEFTEDNRKYRFDIIYLDPPYKKDESNEILYILEKKILDILYIKSIQEDRIKDKYLTGVIYNNIEEEIVTRMYYNYLFEKIKNLKVKNEYITIKANEEILKYIKGKDEYNLNKIKELYYIKEIKIIIEEMKKNNKLEIVIENNERE